MNHWRYKAIDKSQKINIGVIRAIDEVQAVLELTRRLSNTNPEAVIMEEIDGDEYVHAARMQERENKYRDKIQKLMTSPTPAAIQGGHTNTSPQLTPRVIFPPKINMSQKRNSPTYKIISSIIIIIIILLLLQVGRYHVQ